MGRHSTCETECSLFYFMKFPSSVYIVSYSNIIVKKTPDFNIWSFIYYGVPDWNRTNDLLLRRNIVTNLKLIKKFKNHWNSTVYQHFYIYNNSVFFKFRIIFLRFFDVLRQIRDTFFCLYVCSFLFDWHMYIYMLHWI